MPYRFNDPLVMIDVIASMISRWIDSFGRI